MVLRIICFFLKSWKCRISIFPILLTVFFVSLFTVVVVEGAGQLLCDSGFEDSAANGTFPSSGCWKPASAGGGAYAGVTTTAARSGNNGLWIYTGAETYAYWSRPYQEYSASPGQIYSGSAWIRTPSGQSWVEGSTAKVRIEFLNNSRSVLATKNSSGVTAANSDWVQYSVTSDSAPENTKYVRFICNIEKTNGTSGISVANFDDTFFELSVDNNPPNIPSNPSPSDGASGVSITPTLSWSGGDPDSGDTVTYDVYFGTSSNPSKVSSGQSSTSYTPDTLAYATKYYWKIVARDNHGAESTGPVWSFTAMPQPNKPPNVPSNPSPSDGASGVSITPTLSWSGGDPDSGDTVTYDVYFGTSSNPSKVSSGQSSTSYTPDTLAYATKCYWKTVARDNHGAETAGSVWSFTTADTNRGVDLAYQHQYEVMDKYNNSFDVYTDHDAGGNHFYPSGWMGDLSAISFDSNWISECHAGSSCIKITFTAKEDNWAGIYWQDPENNWGTATVGGYDLSGATKITFWAKGENGGEKLEFFIGGISGDNPDSLGKTSTGYVTLTSSWQEYTISLSSKYLSHVIGGFGWATNSSNNPNGATFYLDDIKYNKARPDELRFLVSYETLPFINPDRYLKNVCFVYDNALALIAFLARGTSDDLRRAEILADAFVYAQKNDRYYEDGRLRNAYMSGDLKDHITGKARLPGWWDPDEEKWYEDQFQVSTHVGNLAWTMIALLNYYKSKGGDKYLETAITLGEWIEKHTRDSECNGGYAGGYDGWEPNPDKITWKATEHNIDVYVAFTLLSEIRDKEKWQERASHAKNFVDAMWYGKDQHFWTGTKDACEENKDNIPLDIQAWALMAFNKYNDALVWAENNCGTESDGFKGFDFNTDKDGVWFEGTAQMAVAYQINNEGDKSDFYVEELRNAQASAQNTNGKGIIAASHDGVSTGFDWEYFSRLHIGATAWYIFAEMKYNPLITPTPTPCEVADIEASPKMLKLKRKETDDVTVTVTGKEGCLVVGETVTAMITSGKKRVSVTPLSQDTNINGEAIFTITATKKAGNATVRFEAAGLKTTLKVKVVK